MLSTAHSELWQKIENFELDDPMAEYSFSDRLAAENGWTSKFVLRAIEEYKKFIFLICVSDKSISPSDTIDQIWHLHLLYTKSYWEDLCKNLLGRAIHHHPTKGGKEEMIFHIQCYQDTMDQYYLFFKTKPPQDIWPIPHEHSKQQFQRIDLNSNWIIKKIW